MHSPVSSPFLLSACTTGKDHICKYQVRSGCLSCLLVCPTAAGVTAGSEDRLFTHLSSRGVPGCSGVQSLVPWCGETCYGDEGLCRNLAALAAENRYADTRGRL